MSKILASSVIRGTKMGESHGGLYIVDLDSGDFEQIMDWNHSDIDWSGRGGERGLRGIAIHGDQVIMAASNELFVYDKNFRLLDSYTNPCLRDIHEIYVDGGSLYIACTEFNVILIFDLNQAKFLKAFRLTFGNLKYWLYKRGTLILPGVEEFDPDKPPRLFPEGKDSIHLNSVYANDGKLYFSGTRVWHLFELEIRSIRVYGKVPKSGHNARPFEGGTLLSDTGSKQAALVAKDGQVLRRFPVKLYPQDALKMNHLSRLVAQQGFARGLRLTQNGRLVVGSSPATINVFDFETGEQLKAINLSMDIRNTIHGLEIWPF